MKEVDFDQELTEEFDIFSNQDGPKENIGIVSDFTASDWERNVQEFEKAKWLSVLQGYLLISMGKSYVKLKYLIQLCPGPTSRPPHPGPTY
eukprot:6686618-Ditylum_brightwellii.AAC.1